jgi:putative peptidoglycan lipid II flippase
VAAFPVLAKYFSTGKIKEFSGQIVTAARHIIFWSAPAIIFFIVLRAQIVRVILGAGRFDWAATRLTAACLALFSISVIAQSLVLLLVRAYYAAGRTRLPLIINSICSLSIIALAYGLLEAFHHLAWFRVGLETLLKVNGLAGTEVLVLPLAFSLGVIINLIILWLAFEKNFAPLHQELVEVSLQAIAASLAGGFVAYNALNLFSHFFYLSTFWAVLGQGFFAGLVGLLTWAAILILLRSSELVELLKSLSARVWRTAPIVPEQEGL